MKIFKTLARLLSPKKSEQPSHQPDPESLQPITDTLMAYLDKRQCHYQHKTTGTNTHHLIVPFEDQDEAWYCVFRVNEKSQLVCIFGILSQTVAQDYFASILAAFTKENINIPFGQLSIDPKDGEIHAKIAFDAEFTPLSNDLLDCHIYGLKTLVELAQNIYQNIIQEPEPSLLVLDYITNQEAEEAEPAFFEPTQCRQ